MQYADGLPTKLKKPVPSKTRRPLQPNVPPRPKPSPPLRLPDTPGKVFNFHTLWDASCFLSTVSL